MKILITGATGLVGSEIVKLCRKQNIDVNYLTTSKAKIVSEEHYKGYFWNPRKEEIDLKCFDGVTAIINLAGTSISKRWTKTNKRKILSSRINSIKTLKKGLEKVDTSAITSFVSASAIGIYPNSLATYYNEEEKQVDDSFLGEVVYAWEQEVDTLSTFNFTVAKVRVGLVLSVNGGMLPKLVKPIKNFVGSAFGSGEQWQSWIHLNDLARIFLFVIKNELQGVFNGVAPNPISQGKLVKKIGEVLHRPIILPNIPKPVIQLFLGEMAYLLFASQRVSSKKIRGEGFSFKYGNICAALEDFYAKEGEKELHFF